jgi:GntR family transcriptional regulator / MocR family aminotransferase
LDRNFSGAVVFASIDLSGQKVGYLELAQAIIEAAESGRLTDHYPLPPSRVLAESLGVSRDTVLRCYKHLKSLGWTESHSTRGTFVTRTQRPPAPSSRTLDQSRLSSYARRFVGEVLPPVSAAEPVLFSAVPKQFLPIRRWKDAVRRTSEGVSSREPLYAKAVLGRPELREALSAFLSRTRGIAAVADEIAVFNVSFSALALTCRVFLEPGDVIAMEEPGFGAVREVTSYLGLEVLPVQLDAEGLSLDALQRSEKRVKAVYVTANHQQTTGATMSLARRKQLLTWAQRNNALIIEDDFDGLFHYGTKLPPSLKSMDAQDNVIYLASFWQVLYPLTTLCFAIFPLPFVEIVQHAKSKTMSLTESASQLALSEMLDDGYLQKHIRKVEGELAVRRRALIYELKAAFRNRISLPSYTCGLTLLARFQGYSDNDLMEAAHKAALPMTSTSADYGRIENRVAGEWQIYFAGLEEQSIRKTVLHFARLLQEN